MSNIGNLKAGSLRLEELEFQSGIAILDLEDLKEFRGILNEMERAIKELRGGLES